LWMGAASVPSAYHYKVDDLCVLPFMRSLSAGRNAPTVRILVTISPLLYREVIALSIHERRPDFEVLIAPPEPVDGRTESFAPHVLVRNDGYGAFPEELLGSVVCRVEVLYTDGMAARVSVGERAFTIEDASMGDLLALMDEAEAIASVPRAGA
jgi:hypothetical protein